MIMDTQCRNAAIRAGRLRGPRSVQARANHGEIAAAFIKAGEDHLLEGPPWRKAAIKETYLRLLSPNCPVEIWDRADKTAAALIKYLQRAKTRKAAPFVVCECCRKSFQPVRHVLKTGSWRGQTKWFCSRLCYHTSTQGTTCEHDPNGPYGKGENNVFAKRYRLLSPAKVVYEFVNLNHFVRTHRELFDARSTEPRKGRQRHTCHAAKKLSSVACGSLESWKGWRALSDPETVTR